METTTSNYTMDTKESESITILATIIIPILGAFGILGNILNLTILTFRYRKREVDVMEKGALLGLIALAVSDAMFCVSTLPKAFYREPKVLYEARTARMLYGVYGPFFSNVFMKTSTWLTMIIALARYIGICYPLRARILVGLVSTKIATVATFIFWILLSLPLLWSYQPQEIDYGVNGTSYILLDTGPFSYITDFKLAMTYIWAFIGYFIPVGILTFCNICLIRALRQSEILRAKTARGQASSNREAHRKVTITLICLVVMFLLLVSPSEFLHFYIDIHTEQDFGSQYDALVITNFFQTINFSCHFVLYVTVNVTFRRTLIKVFSLLYRRIRRKEEPRPKRYLRSFQSSTRPGQSLSIETNV